MYTFASPLLSTSTLSGPKWCVGHCTSSRYEPSGTSRKTNLLSRWTRARLVVPEVVRVRLVEGGSRAGFGRRAEGTKEPWME